MYPDRWIPMYPDRCIQIDGSQCPDLVRSPIFTDKNEGNWISLIKMKVIGFH
jgi:hypothetical protein